MGFPMSYPLLTKLAFSSPKSRRPSAQDHGVCRDGGVGKRGKNILVHALTILSMGKVLSCPQKN